MYLYDFIFEIEIFLLMEASKQELEELQSIGGKKKLFEKNPYAKREKKDFKRFFSVVNTGRTWGRMDGSQNQVSAAID